MRMEKKEIKKMFPRLYEELELGEAKVSIDGVQKSPADTEGEVELSDECGCDESHTSKELETSKTHDKLRNFNPQAVDFLRRCDTPAQAEEIIAYLEKKGEITPVYAAELRTKLKTGGVRSFGPKKEENHYFREGGLY